MGRNKRVQVSNDTELKDRLVAINPKVTKGGRTLVLLQLLLLVMKTD